MPRPSRSWATVLCNWPICRRPAATSAPPSGWACRPRRSTACPTPAVRLHALAQALGRLGVGEGAAAALCQELVAAVERGRTRALPEPYPYVYLDGRVVPMRAHGELVAMAVVLAIRVDGGEERKLL